jgi:hypothetical protein
VFVRTTVTIDRIQLASVSSKWSFSGSAKMDGYGGKCLHGTHYKGDDDVTVSH